MSQRAYWEERYTAHPDLTGAGSLGLAPSFVAAQYRAKARQVRRGMRAAGIRDLAHAYVLDVGAGTGAWLRFWQRQGARWLAGCDFSTVSVAALATQFPSETIHQWDITSDVLNVLPAGAYDIVSAFEVFACVLDEAAFRQGIANCAHLLPPGGWLIVSDPILTPARAFIGRTLRSGYATSRTLAEWQVTLSVAGFTLCHAAPATVLLVSPLQARTRAGYWLLMQWWRAVRHVALSERASRVLAPLLIALDALACRLVRTAPTSHLLFAQKQQDKE